MTTKSSYPPNPLSAGHVRKAVLDACRGLRRGDAAAEGLASPFSADQAFELLSRFGVPEGMREFFSLVLIGRDDDAEYVCRFLRRFPRDEQRGAAKALFRLIAVNAEEDKADEELENAFADCVKTAEAFIERGCDVSLGFLKACSSSKFGASRLSKNVETAEDLELAETASRIAELQDSEAVAEFFGAVFSIAERILGEYKRDGLIMKFNQICAALLEVCPEEACNLCEKICYSEWREEGELMMLMAVFAIDGVPALFAEANGETRTELANECGKLAASFVKSVSRHGTEGVDRLVVPYLKAHIQLSVENPRATMQFSSAFNSKVASGADPEALLLALGCFSSPETMETVRQLEETPQALGKYIRFILENDGIRN